MNSMVFAPDIIKDLSPSKIADYLRDHDWYEQEKISSKASIWVKNCDSDGAFEILLPLRSDAPDFVRRVIEILETLEVSERLSKSQILDELTDVNQVARRIGREVIKFALSFPNYYGSEAPISSLGSILSSLQDTINGIAQSLAIQEIMTREQNSAVMDAKLARKKISPDLAREMELSAFGSFKGSFGLKLVSAPANLIESNLVPNSLKEFIDLIRVGSEVEELRGHLFKLRSKSARKYVKFLKSLANSNAGLYVEWGSIQASYGGSARLTVEATKDALRAIKEMKTESVRDFRASGRLTQGDIKTKHFKFEDDQDNEYVGYINDDAMPSSGILSLNQDCEIMLQEKTINFFITDKVETRYTITSLSFPGQTVTGQTSLFS
ncbi:hypothetical protein [Synechocystis sp. CACIAM 05]|uniref:hypothetical protein n=1 Tax=Synechocystis sp. CACIAM 05 TaxID=1933929 RepID=UPI00138E67AD|nr:hypothetical protein [Synechocystis sp. CACIAM 05]QHU98692.1 hypothetical protein BWK47_00110 [Synechocystis sp. CACIAM 05]